MTDCFQVLITRLRDGAAAVSVIDESTGENLTTTVTSDAAAGRFAAHAIEKMGLEKR